MTSLIKFVEKFTNQKGLCHLFSYRTNFIVDFSSYTIHENVKPHSRTCNKSSRIYSVCYWILSVSEYYGRCLPHNTFERVCYLCWNLLPNLIHLSFILYIDSQTYGIVNNNDENTWLLNYCCFSLRFLINTLKCS